MKTPRHVLAKVIADRTKSVSSNRDVAQEVAAFLVSENRASELAPIMRDVMELRAKDGVIEAEAVSAHELDQAALSAIEKIVQQAHPKSTSVRVSQKLQPEMLGGVKVVLPSGEQLDLSISRKLATFKHAASSRKE